MKISVIVPVHNAEAYLGRCLDSILRSLEQSKLEGEILLVENNSNDNSTDIIAKYRADFPKIIRELHCKKWGAAAARNAGAKQAKGDFLWFVDADDYIDERAIKMLVQRAEECQADLVMMGAKRLFMNGKSDYLSAIDEKQTDYRSRFVRYGMGPWQILIRRKWWEQQRFQFHEGIIHEDMELMSALILYTNNFTSVNEPLYFYCENQNSVLHQTKFNEHIFDIFPALEGLLKRFDNATATEEFQAELEWFFIWNLLIDSAKDFKQFPEGRSGLKQSREMLKKYYPKWRKNRFLKVKPLKLRLRVRLNYYS